MKKLIAFITVMILATQIFGAKSYHPKDLITVERKVDAFNSVKVSGPVEVIIITGCEQKLLIKGESRYLDNVETYTQNGELIINITGKLKIKGQFDPYRVEVFVDDINKLTASGACSVDFPEKTLFENFLLTSSGVAKTTFSNVEVTGVFEANISGASRLDIIGRLNKTKFGGSGACNIFFKGNAQNVSLGISGACKSTINAETENIDINASGVCKITLTGHTNSLWLEASGATSVISDRFKAENRKVSFSGAAKISIFD